MHAPARSSLSRSISEHAKLNARKSSLAFAAVVLILISGCILHYERGTYYYSRDFQHISGSDDAYITYRYGWNLAHYHILSWNESGFRRTEGFTNPLWVSLSAFWAILGNKDLLYPSTVASGILVSIAFLYFKSRRVLEKANSTGALFGIFLLCASPVVWLHATSGLESLVFGAGSGLLAYYAITVERPGRAAAWLMNAIAFSLALLRSDGFVYLLVLMIGIILSGNRNWRLVIFGAVVGALGLFIWREASFGQLVPNTALAKMNFGVGARVPTGALLLIQSLMSGTLILLAAGLFGLRGESRSVRLAAITTLLGWLAYYVYIGGDLFLERHLLGVMVLSAGLSGSFFAQVLRQRRGWVFAVALLVGMLLPLYTGDPRFDYLQGKLQDPWILMGKEIAVQRGRYGTIVTFPAGKIPFYAGGDFVDELALNDPALAKVKRPRFVPGHSAGSHALAVDIARQHSPVYSYFAFSFDLTPLNARDVLLWVNNVQPEDGVKHGLNDPQRDIILHAGPFVYTLLFWGR